MEKFQNKYRIPSARLQNWDYASNGAYFITICTKSREHFFGEIIGSLHSNVSTMHCNTPTMQLNEIRQLAQKYWMEIPHHFPFVELGNFVVMPNHTHGILIINKMDGGTDTVVETLPRNVSTTDNINKNEHMAKISPKSGSISTIIRSYKSVVTKNARLIHPDFAWQSRFHDHIIRNSKSFVTIQHYIENNPLNWGKDKFNG